MYAGGPVPGMMPGMMMPAMMPGMMAPMAMAGMQAGMGVNPQAAYPAVAVNVAANTNVRAVVPESHVAATANPVSSAPIASAYNPSQPIAF
jgi:hypothetical protein